MDNEWWRSLDQQLQLFDQAGKLHHFQRRVGEKIDLSLVTYH